MKLNKKTIIIGVFILGIGCAIAGTLIGDHYRSLQARSADSGIPSYDTILPKDNSINELGGWKRVSPSGTDPVFAYTDTIDGITVSVSQQPLPDSIKKDTAAQVTELSKKFNATTNIGTAGMDIYLGTSAKGPQSVIFTKNDLLILIKSEKKIENKSWVSYINSLK